MWWLVLIAAQHECAIVGNFARQAFGAEKGSYTAVHFVIVLGECRALIQWPEERRMGFPSIAAH